MKKCEECKKSINKGEAFLVLESLEDKDKGREFPVHKTCYQKNYISEKAN